MLKKFDTIPVLRKVPRKGYHISFLITDKHASTFDIDELVTLMSEFVIVIPNTMKEFKNYISKRARLCCDEITNSF